MPPVVANIMAFGFLGLLLVAGIAVVVVATRNRNTKGLTAGQSEFAGQLVALDDEVRYAEAFAEPGTTAARNAANARAELDATYKRYLSKYGPDAVPDGNPGAANTAISTGIARTRAYLGGNLTDHPVGYRGKRDTSALRIGSELPVVLGGGSKVFEVGLWVLGIVPGVVFWAKKRAAENYFRALDQRIRTNSAQVDLYLARRVQVLRDLVPTLGNSDEVVAAGTVFAGGSDLVAVDRNFAVGQVDHAYRELATQTPAELGVTPEVVTEARRRNANLQREITAARTLYNDTVTMWNTDIFAWPTKMTVAANAGYTTRPLVVAADNA